MSGGGREGETIVRQLEGHRMLPPLFGYKWTFGLLLVCAVARGLSVRGTSGTICLVNGFVVVYGGGGYSSEFVGIFRGVRSLSDQLAIRIANQLVDGSSQQLHNGYSNCDGALLLSAKRLIQSIVRAVFRSGFQRHFPYGLFSLLFSGSAMSRQGFCVSGHVRI